jgi:hypothetical protein
MVTGGEKTTCRAERMEGEAAAMPVIAIVLVLAAAPLLAGCGRARAKTVPTAPPLEIPAPPRDVRTTETEPPSVALPDAPPDTPVEGGERARERAAQGVSAEPQKSDAVRGEAAEAEPPRPADEGPRPAAATLQASPAEAEGQLEAGILAGLARANESLSGVDYRRLSADAKTQYDTARSFIRQAQEALRTRNLVFARNLADKAAALAAQLAGAR